MVGCETGTIGAAGLWKLVSWSGLRGIFFGRFCVKQKVVEVFTKFEEGLKGVMKGPLLPEHDHNRCNLE